MKKILFILLISMFLFSCIKEEVKEDTKKIVKQDFFIETKKIKDFNIEQYLKKSWKIKTSQDVMVASQAFWKVKELYIKDWQNIQEWQIIAILEDNISNYNTSLKKIENSLAKARLNYKSTNNTYNKNIANLKLNLDNFQINQENSKSSIELNKIKNSIKKIDLDYEKLKSSNIKTIGSFVSNTKIQSDNIKILIADLIDFSDKILSVTLENKDTNKSFKDFLWAKDTRQKQSTKEELKKLIEYNENILTNIVFDENNSYEKNIEKIEIWYKLIFKFLLSIEKTIDNSLPSLTRLPESKIIWYKTTIDTFLSRYTWNNQWFISLVNSVKSFLEAYKQNENSLLKQISLLKNDEEIFIKSLDINIESNNLNLKELVDNKTLALQQIDNSIRELELSYEQALNNYKKLSIESPMSWIVWAVHIELWQELSKWSKVLNILNNIENEIIIAFNKKELKYITVWQYVTINHENTSFQWYISSISMTADENLKYHCKISFSRKLDFTWNIVEVEIPVSFSDKIILPINIIKIKGQNKAIVNILLNNKIVEKVVTVWDIYGDNIEIVDQIHNNTKIITTNISNFDENKFNLKIK